MQTKVKILSFLTIVEWLCTSCSTLDYREPGSIVLNTDTSRIEGYFSFGSESAIFTNHFSNKYNPFNIKEEKKCVTILFDSAIDISKLHRFDRKIVDVYGRTLEYDALEEASTDRDKLLSKKFYRGNLVENFCLRKFVFIAKDINNLQLP
jgi:hypothetical protein